MFRDGAGGRRATIVGTRLDVWQVVDTLRASRSSLEATSDYLGVSVALVQAAARYYAAYGDEVREFAKRARAAAARELALWEGEQAVLP